MAATLPARMMNTSLNTSSRVDSQLWTVDSKRPIELAPWRARRRVSPAREAAAG
jgi:hypothetical protein